MNNIAIRVENLSKLPRPAGYIGRARQRHDTLRDAARTARVDFLPRISRINTPLLHHHRCGNGSPRTLGPGFLETVYEAALAYEFEARGVPYARQRHCR